LVGGAEGSDAGLVTRATLWKRNADGGMQMEDYKLTLVDGVGGDGSPTDLAAPAMLSRGGGV